MREKIQQLLMTSHLSPSHHHLLPGLWQWFLNWDLWSYTCSLLVCSPHNKQGNPETQVRSSAPLLKALQWLSFLSLTREQKTANWRLQTTHSCISVSVGQESGVNGGAFRIYLPQRMSLRQEGRALIWPWSPHIIAPWPSSLSHHSSTTLSSPLHRNHGPLGVLRQALCGLGASALAVPTARSVLPAHDLWLTPSSPSTLCLYVTSWCPWPREDDANRSSPRGLLHCPSPYPALCFLSSAA